MKFQNIVQNFKNNLPCILTFLFLNIFFWALLSYQYFHVVKTVPSFLGTFFSLTYALGHYFLLAILLFLIIIIFSLFRRRICFSVAILFTSIVSLFLLLDIFIFTQYRQHLSPTLVKMFLSAGGELIDLDFSMTLMGGGVVLCIIGLEFFFARLSISQLKLPFLKGKWKSSYERRFHKFAFILCFFSCLIFNMLHAVARYTMNPVILMRVPSLAYTFPLSANSFLSSIGLTRNNARGELSLNLQGSLMYPLEALECYPEEDDAFNILIIALDSWRTASFNEEVMPHLFKKSKEGIRFENHYSASNCTRGGIFSLFYGLPASYWQAFLAEKKGPVMLSKLKENAYELEIFSSSTLLSPEFSETAFVDIENLRISSEGEDKIARDNNAKADFFTFLRERDKSRPFFSFLFLDALHGYASPIGGPRPFAPAVEGMNYLLLSNESDRLPYINLYNNAAYNLDISVKEVFDELQNLDLFKNTIVIVTSDHGQELNDSHTNSWGHNSMFSKYQTHVPLIIFYPKGAKNDEGPEGGKVFTHLTSHFDLVPTLLGRVLNCKSDAETYSVGKDLFLEEGPEFLLLSSYSDNAIYYEENIFHLDKYQISPPYTIEGKEIDLSLPSSILKKSLDLMSKFYKK